MTFPEENLSRAELHAKLAEVMAELNESEQSEEMGEIESGEQSEGEEDNEPEQSDEMEEIERGERSEEEEDIQPDEGELSSQDDDYVQHQGKSTTSETSDLPVRRTRSKVGFSCISTFRELMSCSSSTSPYPELAPTRMPATPPRPRAAQRSLPGTGGGRIGFESNRNSESIPTSTPASD